MAARKAVGRKKKSPFGFLFGWLLVILIILAAFFVFYAVAGERVRVATNAMSPAVNTDDMVLVNQIAYLLTDPGRGDIIRFRSSYEAGTDFIRRVIALPGETIQIMDGKVYVNGRELKESYVSGSMQYGGTAATPYTLSRDEYYVMSDNRSNNFDSRDPTVGTVRKNSIYGRVWLRIQPWNQFGLLH